MVCGVQCCCHCRLCRRVGEHVCPKATKCSDTKKNSKDTPRTNTNLQPIRRCMTISEECPSALLSCCVLPAAAAVEIVAALTHRRISQQKTERPSWEIAKIRIQSELHLIFLWMHFVHNSPIFRAGYETLVLLAKGTTNMWAPGQHSRGQRNNFWLEIKAFSSTNWSTARQRQTHRHRVEMGRAALHWGGKKQNSFARHVFVLHFNFSFLMCVFLGCVLIFS